MQSSSFDIWSNNELSASFGTTTTIGPTGGSHVKIDSGGVKISGSAGNYTFISGSGMSVFSGGVQTGIFGSDVTLTCGTLTLQSTAGTTGDDRLVTVSYTHLRAHET